MPIAAATQEAQASRANLLPGDVCCQCGAWRGELGSEPTIALFIEHIVQVFSEVHRVLRPDGTLWVNLGDSYAGSGKGPSNSLQPDASQLSKQTTSKGALHSVNSGLIPDGLKPKDLCLIPERFAIAMQEAGWWVRSRIAWCKTSAMPESVTDRPTSAWEHIWLFSKSARYYYNADAVKQSTENSDTHGRGPVPTRPQKTQEMGEGIKNNHSFLQATWGPVTMANQRNFWVLGPDPYPEAHFATFAREVPRRCILAGSRPGDLVLDPFVGSGTTLFVAEELGRDSIGIELQPEYVKLAEKRMRGARTPLPGLAP